MGKHEGTDARREEGVRGELVGGSEMRRGREKLKTGKHKGMKKVKSALIKSKYDCSLCNWYKPLYSSARAMRAARGFVSPLRPVKE